MEAENIAPSAISAFESTFKALVSGDTGMIPESTITPVPELVSATSITGEPDVSLLAKTVVLKLNGGLGTGMGLDKAKSLLKVKGDDTFLDLTAKQVMQMRKDYGFKVKFMLMNSFSTSEDTLAFFDEKFPALAAEEGLEMLQNKVPKLDATTYEPATCESDPSNEWCPPGHGDLYAALVGSGRLDALLKDGYKYMFVSNSDNLGATLDLHILTHFAGTDAPFMMECCERTENDKKGGHLAVRSSDGQLILRESAMCLDEDEDSFQDTSKHRFFNTNNLWIRLDKLKEIIDKHGGFIPLPMIMNKKTVDPKDDSSQKVVQLETAMGAAIECFEGATAIVVPRSRFVPVKKCNDLLLLRSDAYIITPDHRPVLNPKCDGVAPVMDLDSKKYKLVGALEEATAGGVPSLVNCKRLKVKGLVRMSNKTKFVGEVSITNSSDEAKFVPPGEVTGEIDLTSAVGMGVLKPTTVKTSPIDGQKPGTSGLRKKTKEFMEDHYLNNFVQSTFDAIKETGTDISEGSLVIGGDGRYFNPDAIQTIIKMGIANGVKRFWVGHNGLLSTPAVSAVIRERGPVWQKAFGAFILTASHNPGGPDEDFGIKYNCENGGPAPEKLTDAIYENTKTIKSYKIAADFPSVDVGTIGKTTVIADDNSAEINVEVIDSTEAHVALLKTIFDFDAIKALLDRDDFSMVYDTMSGVNGPYSKAVFVEELGQSEEVCMNSEPKDDFGGGHADPNLTYAKQLVEIMGLDRTGQKIDVGDRKVPSFGAAADGDGDRNMILGSQFFVTPSDSLAIIASYADVIPFFRTQGGLKGVARSMPTSGAVDRVAADLNFDLFETPTGWKYFGNLMDSKALYGGTNYTPFLCGEESFGTGSDHVREKDGIWAVLAWLAILASVNTDPSKPLVSVEDIVRKHWAKYGRNYYCRWDFEGVDKAKATAMMDKMRADSASNTGRTMGKYTIATADDFTYVDPVDGSVAKNQGIRFLMSDGSRVVFRLSGTAGSGATVRMYIEQYEPENIDMKVSDALEELVKIALELCDINGYCGTETPTVIT
jgi:phosphoglucomutase